MYRRLKKKSMNEPFSFTLVNYDPERSRYTRSNLIKECYDETYEQWY